VAERPISRWVDGRRSVQVASAHADRPIPIVLDSQSIPAGLIRRVVRAADFESRMRGVDNLLRRNVMRVMVIVKATKESEEGQMPSTELLTAMGNFNEELVKAGVMLAGEGLHPSSKGKRVRFSGKQRTVVDGPFAETKELVAGYWLWNVKSMDEAVEWVRRCPNPMQSDSEIEIRRVFEAEDFGAELTPDLRAQEERLRAEAEKLKPR